MEEIKKLLESIRGRLTGAAIKDAVASKPIVAGDRQVLVLSEVSMAFGGGGGSGEDASSKPPIKGTGGGAGGAAKAVPVAVLVVDQGKVSLERIGT